MTVYCVQPSALVVLIERISAARQARTDRGQPYGPVIPGMTVPSPE
jgi:hypothetical protein